MSWSDFTRRGRRSGRGTPAAAVPPAATPTRDAPVAVPELDDLATDGAVHGNGDAPYGYGDAPNGNGNGRAPHGAGSNGSTPNGTGWTGSGTLRPRVHPRGPDDVAVDAVLGLGPTATADRHLDVTPVAPVFRPGESQEPDVVAVVAPTGRLAFVSASAGRLLGYDVRDAVGLDVFTLFEPSSRTRVEDLFDDLVARRRPAVVLELSCHRADGAELHLELVAGNHLGDPVGGVMVSLRDVTARRLTEARVADLDRRQHALVESLADGLVLLDRDGTVVRVNEAFEVMFWAPRTRVLGRRFDDLLEDAADHGVELFDESGATVPPGRHPVLVALEEGRRIRGQVLGFRDDDGPARWVRIGAQSVVAPDGTVTGAVGTFSDITDAKRADYALRQEEEFLRVLLGTLDEGIVACDAEGRMTIFNPAARRLHGLDDDVEPIGRVPSVRHLRRPDGTPLAPEENPLQRAMAGEHVRNVEIVLAPDGGEQRKVSVNGQALVDEYGWKLGAVVAMHDVTEQRRYEAQLADLAHHDPLTGLANRTLLAERIRVAVDGLREGPVASGPRPPDAGGFDRVVPEHPGVAVYLLDLDNFKDVNDDFGHEVGDDLLVAVARRLLAIVRPTDTVARLGGDEFVVVCQIESGEEEMQAISTRISSALARPYRIDGRTVVAGASVGGVFVDDPDTDPSKLLSLADDAMYAAKSTRRRPRRSAAD